uniref:CHAT domain-containing protein n=1 Tax=Flexithrix dorotheae TaxID=70993 RepID=UPI000476C5ED
MKISHPNKLSITALFLFICFSQLCAQSPTQLLELGKRSYQFDKLDSANDYYSRAYQQKDSNIKLKAVTGLLNVALLRSDLAVADSLVKLGEGLIEPTSEKEAIYPFEIIKGEYYTKKSELDKALAQHLSVAQKSKNWEEGKVILADALFYAALSFERLAQYDSGIVYIEKAYQFYQENLDTSSVRFTEIYNGLGNCYYRANDFQKSKSFYLKSKKVCEEKLGPISSDLAVCLSNLSNISRAEENYQEAITYTEQAFKIHRALDNQKGIASAYYALGVYYYFLGDYGRTKDYMEACIALRNKLYHPNHYALINPLEVLGIALEESGNYDQTLFYLKKVRPIIVSNYGAGSLQEGLNSENMAICFQQIGTLDSSWHYIQISNKILSEKLDKNAYQLATHHYTLADILQEKGNLKEAKESIYTSNRIYEQLGMAQSSEYAQNITLLALLAAEEKDWQSGDAYFAKALSLIKGTEKDTSTVMMPNNLVVLNEYISYLYQQYQAIGNDSILTSLQAYSNKYITISENLRKQFIDPYTKSILIKDNTQLFNKLIGIYHQLYAQTKESKYLHSAYKFSEYGRAALLRDMQDEKIQSFAGIPDSIIQQEKLLKQQVSDLNQQLIENTASNDLKQQLLEAKEALNKHITHLAEAYPAYHQLKFNNTIPSLQEIQSFLKKGESLVEYMQDDTAYYALLVNSEKVEFKYLGDQNKIDATIAHWKSALIQQDEMKIRTHGHSLHQYLWKPIESVLNGEKVVVVPTGPIFYLNLETLSKSASDDDFLIYDYNISYALSFNTYFAEDTDTKKGTIISIAPGFEEELKTAYQQNIDTLDEVDESYLQTVRQPWTVKLANTLQDKFENTAYVGLQATESNVKKNINKAGVLYFGTHAITNAVDPLRSKLVLAKEVGRQNEDGYLHAYELFGLQLNAELAVLNACESGLGGIKKGEGMISLAYSMQYAGCPSTVMSLWKVDEKVNTQITEAFFEQLAAGKTKSEALRTAKLTYLNSAKGALKNPFYWGGMVLMGKDNTLEIQENNILWSALLLLVVVLAAGALF